MHNLRVESPPRNHSNNYIEIGVRDKKGGFHSKVTHFWLYYKTTAKAELIAQFSKR